MFVFQHVCPARLQNVLWFSPKRTTSTGSRETRERGRRFIPGSLQVIVFSVVSQVKKGVVKYYPGKRNVTKLRVKSED